MTNQKDLPDYISMDFAMTEENLWHVWYATNEDLRLIGVKEDIYTHWVMGDSYTQIADHCKKYGTIPISGINLRDLKNIYYSLQNKSLPTWFPWFNRIYFVENNNKQYWVDKKPENGEKIIFTGNLSHIKKL